MEFDTTGFTIFSLPAYFFCAEVGILVGVSVYLLLLMHCCFDFRHLSCKLFLIIPAILLGSKLFGCLKSLVYTIHIGTAMTGETFANAGIVYYGGLIGFIGTYKMIFRYKKCIDYMTESEYFALYDAAAAAVPMFHLCGRIGCFMAGCCYGTETQCPLSLRYTNYIDGCNVTAQRIPVQLIEAGGELLIAVLLIIFFCRKQFAGKLIYVYLLGYSVMRFVLEYYRGDRSMEILNCISMSQIISLLLLLIALHRMIVPILTEKGFRLWKN